MMWSPKENDDFFGEPQEDTREPGGHEDDAAPMCVWCEARVPDACKSHYDTMTCTHRVIVPTAEEFGSAIEARAALNGGNVIERLQFALQRLADAAEALGVNHFGEDWRSDEVQELQAATHAARLVLGPNDRGNAHLTAAQE